VICLLNESWQIVMLYFKKKYKISADFGPSLSVNPNHLVLEKLFFKPNSLPSYLRFQMTVMNLGLKM